MKKDSSALSAKELSEARSSRRAKLCWLSGLALLSTLVVAVILRYAHLYADWLKPFGATPASVTFWCETAVATRNWLLAYFGICFAYQVWKLYSLMGITSDYVASRAKKS